MQTVRDESGKRYLLMERTEESSHVRDPVTGEERKIRNANLERIDGSPLTTAAAGIEKPLRAVVSAAHDEQDLGLLVDLADRGPVPVREMIGTYDLCESALHAQLAEFRAAGLIDEKKIGGERGYQLTQEGRQAVARLRCRDRGSSL